MAYLSTYGHSTINYSPIGSYSGLEQRVSEYAFQVAPVLIQQLQTIYAASTIQNSYKKESESKYMAYSGERYVVQELFLSPIRPLTQFIRNASQVKEHVEKAFKITTGEELPKDFTIEIIPEAEFRKFNKDAGILGFALNRKNNGVSNIVVKENNLDVLMIVIGHEIGHILTMPALTMQDEEAKAFSFQFAWAKSIFENDIAGLGNSINPEIFQPAQNGIHDIAFSFVQKLIASGRKSLEVYGLIASGIIGINNWSLIDF